MLLESKAVAGNATLPLLIAEPAGTPPSSPVLLFLHGKGEASAQRNELSKVLFHASPPFRALTEELRAVTVVAPQAPRAPEDPWSWREYAEGLGAYLRATFAGRPLLATGFSRGGLGVLQLVRAHPGLVRRWALVDPQKPLDAKEQQAITPSGADRESGWLRFGRQIERNTPFSKYLAGVLPPESSRFVDLPHAELAVRAYRGDALGGSVHLYDSLGLSFVARGN